MFAIFQLVLQKIKNKKWLALCLLAGNILLAAIAASGPMYTKAALQRQLTGMMRDYVQQQMKYPTTVYLFASGLGANSVANIKYGEELLREIPQTFGTGADSYIVNTYLDETKIVPELKRSRDRAEKHARVGYLYGMEAHVEMVSGSMYSAIADDGAIEGVVSEKCLTDMKLLVGETLTLPDYKDADGNPQRIRIVGVYKNSSDDDPFWFKSPNEYFRDIFVEPDAFESSFLTPDARTQSLRSILLMIFDYESVTVDNAVHILNAADEYRENLKGNNNISYKDYFTEILTEYRDSVPRTIVTLRILQIPIYALLAAFIFMVTRQMLELERNEISVFKSRGASKKQIISIYLIQSLLIAAVSFIIAIPLSVLCCQIIGSANSFLEFVSRKSLKVEITGEVIAFTVAALAFSVAVMAVPVFKYADVSIVEGKRAKNRSSRPVTQRFFLDFAVLLLSLYGLYSFGAQKDELARRVADGGGLDPLMFLSSSLFIIGSGLVLLRIIPLIVTLVYKAGKKRWNPALYTSLLWVTRTKNSQSYIIVFLIVTIAMGIFNAKTARTVNGNEEERLRYIGGADIVLSEPWPDNREQVQEDESGMTKLTYEEPDFNKYTVLDGIESITKVIYNQNASVPLGGVNERVTNVTLMGINTKEFGETADFKAGLIPGHWYEHLNAISKTPSAVLVSSNFRDKYGFKLGDMISYGGGNGLSAQGTIYGFVDYWPSYISVTEQRQGDGSTEQADNFLIVANIGYLQSKWGITPYQIWMRARESTAFIYDFAAENKLSFTVFRDTKAAIIEMKNDPTMQGTNGILTVGFIVTLMFCAAGFLIYWILSINSRVLQFGIFRAMGMSMGEIIGMLVCEQVCISGLAIGFGVVTGLVASRLYIPLVQIAYAAKDTVIPLEIAAGGSDMARLLIVAGIVIAACMLVLANIISGIKISQALKLGED